MDNIKLLSIPAKEIEIKYNDSQFPLVFQYIGNNRTHGDEYYSLNWYEILYNFNIIGLFCFYFKKDSLHISVFEIFEKNKGLGTKAMEHVFNFCKSRKYSSITLQSNNDKAKIFYLRLGFIKKSVNNTPYLIKYL